MEYEFLPCFSPSDGHTVNVLLHRSILCTIRIEHTGLDHLPSNLNIVNKMTVLLIMLLHLLVGTAH